MFSNELFEWVVGRRVREVEVSGRGYELALGLLGKHLELPSAQNVHYKNDVMYAGLIYLSMNNTYAQTAMDDLRDKHGLDAPTGAAFRYRLRQFWASQLAEQKGEERNDYKRLVSAQMRIWKMLLDANDELLSVAKKFGVLHRPAICAVDYTKIPYYGDFNPNVVRSKKEKGTNHFYEYASISIVEKGRRICIYSLPVNLLDLKSEVLERLITEARLRGVVIETLLLDRAFFTVECINLLNGMNVSFIMPCVCNSRVNDAVDSFGRPGRFGSFSISNSEGETAEFTMVVCRGKKKGRKLIPFATNIDWLNPRSLVKRVPRMYRKRWSIETTFRKVKEMIGKTTSQLAALRQMYFMLATILYNIWQVVNISLFFSGARRRPNPYRGKDVAITVPKLTRLLERCLIKGVRHRMEAS
jgi:DDE family transposase